MPSLFFLFLLLSAGMAQGAVPQFFLPKTSLDPQDLAIIVNDNDPLSRQIGEYYQKRRNIPLANLIHVRFSPGATIMSQKEFTRIKAEVDRKSPKSIQAFALTWAAPYRVACMSITSAFTFGFNQEFCSHQCGSTKTSPYFDSPSAAPYTDLKIRPTMSLAGLNLDQVKALIDRGIATDGSHPPGTAYLLKTDDKSRNVRSTRYPAVMQEMANLVEVQVVASNFIKDKDDVLFYFTGMVTVPHLDTLKFLPGAIADHLTSTGGQLTDSTQMSSLRWLEAGATGSYGTVVEPCNHLAKFPSPAVVMYWYLAGNSLIEAYWKSVQRPGEGIFIGEPLAKPYGGFNVYQDKDDIVLRTQALPAGTYGLLSADSMVGPYRREPISVTVHPGMNELHFKNLDKAVYRLIRLS
ncbi:MAG: TIGR03790 family protein [Gallionellaceae bacterium]|nr:TIGR03790 family protein [Gallionellaceae bacterium]